MGTGRGRSYKSHQVQSVCQTSLTQVLGGGGGHQGDCALLGPVLGCAKPMYAQRGRLRRVKRLTQKWYESGSPSRPPSQSELSPGGGDNWGRLRSRDHSHQGFGRERTQVKRSAKEAKKSPESQGSQESQESHLPPTPAAGVYRGSHTPPPQRQECREDPTHPHPRGRSVERRTWASAWSTSH